MYDEDYIMVEAWNDQLGAWHDVDEAKTVEDARRMIAEFQANAGEDQQYTYSILQVKREVIKP